MKGTLGSSPTWGSQPLTSVLDSIGGMAKTPEDLAHLMGVLQSKDYTAFLVSSWSGLKVGFVDPKLWQPADFVVESIESFTEQSVSHAKNCRVSFRLIISVTRVCVCHSLNQVERSRCEGWGASHHCSSNF